MKRQKDAAKKRIGLERIKKLFVLAEKNFRLKPEYSHRYVQLARKIAMRYNIRMPKHLKRRFCKKCYRYLVPGKNSEIRTRGEQKAVTVKCMECGNVTRYPYKREAKK